MDRQVYDRWGNLVFASTEIPYTWNGKFNQDDVSSGVYVYVVRVKYMFENKSYEELVYSDVTVVK